MRDQEGSRRGRRTIPGEGPESGTPLTGLRVGSTEGPGVTLKVDKDEHGLWTVLRITGELDLMTSPEVRQHVHDAVAAGRRELVLDLSEVFFCDSSGVGVLIASRKLMRSCQGRLHLILPAHGAEEGSHVNRVLAALGVRRLFEVYSDVSDAVDEEAQPLSA